jgi:hypothetical protein
MTQKYAKVQAEILNAYDTAQVTRRPVEVTVSGHIVKVSPLQGIAPFTVEPHGSMTLWETCNFLSNRTI